MTQVFAEQDWKTHLAYTDVTQIAMSPTEVYAVADGSLFSVNKVTERITTYDQISGLHGTDIVCIYYDNASAQLLIAYRSGKIDLLSENGVRYVGGLYDKDMTQRKDIYNVTVAGRTAYLSTHYGVQTFDFKTQCLVDSYWLRPGGEETPVSDVLVTSDSIYAFNEDSLFFASLHDNLVDYHVWNREPRSNRIQPETGKGQHYTDGDTEWSVGHTDGVIRDNPIDGEKTYKPSCPLVNIPYRVRYAGGKLGVVPGGYDAVFYRRTGIVMTREDGAWRNYDEAYLCAASGLSKIQDISDIAIDPSDPSHFFVASFGYGLVEFRNNVFYQQYNESNSILESLIPSMPYPYTWVDGLTFDADGNLWLLNISQSGVKVLMRDGTWKAFSNAACFKLDRTKDLIISNQNPNIKIVSDWRAGVGVFDDNGTLDDDSDDRAVYVPSFIDENGDPFTPSQILTIYQSSDGALWIGTYEGLIRVNDPAQLLEGDYHCRVFSFAVSVIDNEKNLSITSITEDDYSRIWVGTAHKGLYCLSSDLTQVEMHLSADNAPLLSNSILSLCAAPHEERLFIGTAGGLMEMHYSSPDDPLGIQWGDEEAVSIGSMKNWKTHFSYNNISSIEDAGNHTFCVADGALLVINKSTEEVLPLSKLNGLNGSDIAVVCYNSATRKTLIVYRNGMLDVIDSDGDVKNMLDVYLTTETTPAEFYSAHSYGDRVYICSSLGIMNINLRRDEVAETYVLLKNDQELFVRYTGILGDSIYAATQTHVYAASLRDNLVDFIVWKELPLPFDDEISNFGVKGDYLYVHTDGDALYCRHDNQWTQVLPDKKWTKVFLHPQSILGQTSEAIYEIQDDAAQEVALPNMPTDIIHQENDYWLSVSGEGLLKWNHTDGTQKFDINSPYVNFCYRLRAVKDKLIMLPGGYGAGFYNRPGSVMMYENGVWNNFTYLDMQRMTGWTFNDMCDAAIDPNDPSHFYVAAFGYGLIEFRNNVFAAHYNNENSAIETVLPGRVYPYLWVDGLMLDKDNNLWMLNNSSAGVKVLMKDGSWVRIENDATRSHSRTKDLLIWNRNPNIKILTCERDDQGIGVFDDNGTIANTGDDKAVYVSSFVDQNEKPISPQFIYSICQMANGEIWVGTERGILIFPDIRKLLNNDNHCRRIIIPRNDGSGLGDYLLGDEMINAIVEDAAGRKWIGTETSGLYLISEDGLETIEHFTKTNSPLVSDAVYSLAIQPRTGEVFIGASIGLLSYQSDANEAKKDMSEVYAYPNPVPHNYTGYVSITGLMDNSVVNIVDAGGNLVCKTRSNGGLAVWDGKDARGRRVTPGIYTALCNAEGGHAVVKIFITR